MQDKIFFFSCFGFALGVLCRSLVFINISTVLFAGVLAAALFLFFLISKNNLGIILSITLLVFSLGVVRFHVSDVPAPVLGAGEHRGLIVDDPDVRESNQKLIVETEETKILLTAGLGERFKYGDLVSFKGEIKKPENFTTDTGKVFDYVNYLRKDGIYYISTYPEVEILERGGGNPVKRGLFALKNFFLSKINFAIPAPESHLLGGLILGERGAFDKELRQALVDTGTVHIVALSGYNVTIVAEWIMRVFAFIPGLGAFIAGILGITLFVIMSGGGSTALRAGIMAILVLVARATGRTYDVARALTLAAIAMILVNPFVLVFDVSFQLSFIATVAVIFFYPKLQKYFHWVTERWKLQEVVGITFAAYIFVLPFILYKMGNLSIVALPANILILPFIPLTMMFGFFTAVAGAIWYAFAVPLGWISYLFLHWEISVVEFFAKFSFASFSIPYFPLWLTIIIYAVFCYKLFGASVKKFILSPT